MAVVRSIGPRVTQPIIYQDATFGGIAAVVTAVDKTAGTITVTTFPPMVAPQLHTAVQYDDRGIIVGSWRYHETDVV